MDPARGSDEAEGSSEKPWKTLAHAAGRLKAGDTLILRDGVHVGPVTLAVAGTPEKPITIRSAPGELAILDGGFAEFRENPAASWDVAVSRQWARLVVELKRKGKPIPVLDGMIAATALEHGLSVATRNVSDFERAGVKVVDPFA